MLNLRWDHTVHYVNDLDAAVRVFQDHGLHAFRGGSHVEWGTYNALSYFGLSYLEFLGIENPDVLRQAKNINLVCRDAQKLLPEHQILSRVVMRTDNIEAIAAHLLRFGVALSRILAGKRLDAQGRLITWKMMTIDGDFRGLPYPFIIQWDRPDAERLQQLRENAIDVPHPAGEVKLQSAIFHVDRPELVAAHWQELFSLRREERAEGSILKIAGQTFDFRQGNANRITALQFNTDAPSLKGTTLRIGEGDYIFQ